MSDSLDLEEVETVLRNMGHVIQRVETMAQALGSAPRGVDLPRGCDLSGLVTALRCLESVGVGTSSQAKELYKTVTDATKADKSWGDHVKGWLTPPKTGVHWLDTGLKQPASFAAGATDAGHDLAWGVKDLVVDFADIKGDFDAYHHGEVMPIQKPGLGLINIGAHPHDTLKSLVGWQYHDDPSRMGGYAITNILTMIATGGAGEVAEGGMAARLARLTEEGAATRTSIKAAIDDLKAERDGLPSTRQRNKGKGDWVRHRKMSIDREIEKLKNDLAKHDEHMSNVRDRYTALSKARANPWAQAWGNLTNLLIPSAVKKIVNWFGHDGEATKWVLEKWFEIQGIGQGSKDYTENREARQRLAEFAAEHPRGLT